MTYLRSQILVLAYLGDVEGGGEAQGPASGLTRRTQRRPTRGNGLSPTRGPPRPTGSASGRRRGRKGAALEPGPEDPDLCGARASPWGPGAAALGTGGGRGAAVRRCPRPRPTHRHGRRVQREALVVVVTGPVQRVLELRPRTPLGLADALLALVVHPAGGPQLLPRRPRSASLPTCNAPPPRPGRRQRRQRRQRRRRRRHPNALRSGLAPLKSPSRKFTPQPPPGPRVGHAAAVFPAPRPLAVSHWSGRLRGPPSHSPALRHVGKVAPNEEPPHCGPASPAPASGLRVTSGGEALRRRPVSGGRAAEVACLPCPFLPGVPVSPHRVAASPPEGCFPRPSCRVAPTRRGPRRATWRQ